MNDTKDANISRQIVFNKLVTQRVVSFLSFYQNGRGKCDTIVCQIRPPDDQTKSHPELKVFAVYYNV